MDALKTASNFLFKNAHCLVIVALALTTTGNFQLFISRQTLIYWDHESSVLFRFLWDGCLLLLFIIQHSFMATNRFKRQTASWLPIPALLVSERLIYNMASCLCLLFVIVQWHSIPETYLWLVDTRSRNVLWTFFLLLHCVCWFFFGLQVLLMDCAEMLGISQVHSYHTSRTPLLLQKVSRGVREIYSRMRHPGALLITLMLWAHPLMTLDRLLLASILTTYMIGRHSFDDKHYEVAKKYFTLEHTKKVSRTSTRYE